MSWVSTHTFTTGEVVIAAQMNVISGDLDAINTRIANNDYIAASETTTSTSFTNLATSGPAVTVTTGTFVLVALYAGIINNTAGSASAMGFAVSSATTVAASDDKSLSFTSPSNGVGIRVGGTFPIGGLTAGSNTFTAKYKVTANTGTFLDRRLVVIPQF